MTRRPCDVLTPQQATGFRLDLPGDQLTGLHGTLRCQWTTTTGSARGIVRMVDVTLSANMTAYLKGGILFSDDVTKPNASGGFAFSW